jgi:hypothetical protein
MKPGDRISGSRVGSPSPGAFKLWVKWIHLYSPTEHGSFHQIVQHQVLLAVARVKPTTTNADWTKTK